MQVFFKTRKGFTIIELLIVVAIIGILATIIAVSVREASDRTRNTKIVTSVTQIRKVAEDIYLQEFTYEVLCLAGGLNTGYNSVLLILKDDIEKYGGTNLVCYSSRYSYCVSVQMGGQQTKYFCIDDGGGSVESVTNVCTSSNIKCE